MGNISENGSRIQEELVKLLKTCTPYVKSEAAHHKFDVAAYIPEPQLKLDLEDHPATPEDGWTKTGLDLEKFEADGYHCEHKRLRTLCDLKREAFLAEARLDDAEKREYLRMYKPQEYEELLKKEEENRNDKVEEYWGTSYILHSAPRFGLMDKYWSDEGHFLNSVKDMTLCDAPSCPYYKRTSRRKEKFRATHHLNGGFHLFEIKGNQDTFSRLSYQIPNVLLVADYCWLVLGDEQETPAWLPPYIGVMRYNDEEKRFSIQHAHRLNPRHSPMYWHVLDDHNIDCPKEVPFWALEKLLKKMVINSIFRWESQGCIAVDMSHEIERLQGLLLKVNDLPLCAQTKLLDDVQGAEETNK